MDITQKIITLLSPTRLLWAWHEQEPKARKVWNANMPDAYQTIQHDEWENFLSVLRLFFIEIEQNDQ